MGKIGGNTDTHLPEIFWRYRLPALHDAGSRQPPCEPVVRLRNVPPKNAGDRLHPGCAPGDIPTNFVEREGRLRSSA